MHNEFQELTIRIRARTSQWLKRLREDWTTRMVKVISGALYFREAAICGETSTWRARTMKGLLSKLCELDGGLICRRQILEMVQPVLL